MKKRNTKILVLLVCAGLVYLGCRFLINKKQGDLLTDNENESFCEKEMQTLGDMSSFEDFNGLIKPVDFSNFPEAKTYYTRITETVKSGPNFAKHFTLVYWGCGTDCYGFSVVDADTGEIIAFNPVNGEYQLRDGYGLDSTYFVLDPVHAEQERKFYKIVKGNDGKYQLEIACTELSEGEMYEPAE